MKLNTWYSAEVLDDICDEDTTCCELVAFFGQSLVLHTTSLTLFKLIFPNEVKNLLEARGIQQRFCTTFATRTRPVVN